jgi:arginase
LGATAALGAKSTGVVWFDAHGDFNTPETSSSGFLDGMGLAILTGLCWQKLASCFDSFEALPMEHIVQVGVRDLDSEEMINLEQSAITRIAPTDLQRLPVALAKLSKRVRKVYVHVDVDVLDVSEGLANSYAGAGGIKLNELYHALKLIGETIPIAAASITSYDPRVDSDGRIARALPGIIEFLARC